MVRASNDEQVRQILEMRAKARHEEASRLYEAEKRGEEKGKLEMAKELYNEGYPIEKLAEKLKMSVEELNNLLK